MIGNIIRSARTSGRLQAGNLLHSATANVGVAISDLFPSFSLTGAVGYQSQKLSRLTNAGSDLWNFGAAIDVPVLNEQRWAQIGIDNARQEQALISYKLVALNSLSEVEGGLVALQYERSRRDLLKKIVAANQDAFNFAQQLRQAGTWIFSTC